MADDQKTAEELPAEQAAADLAAAEEAARAAAGAGDGGDVKSAAEIERLKTALAAANKEAVIRRKRLDELEKAEADRAAAKLTETEKQAKELADARADAEKARGEAREMLIKAAFIAEAATAGVAHPEDAFALADKSDVDVNDVGAVTGVAESMKTLVDAGRLTMNTGKRRAPDLNGGAGGQGRGGDDDEPVKLSNEQLATAKKLGIEPKKYGERLREQLKRQKAAVE